MVDKIKTLIRGSKNKAEFKELLRKEIENIPGSEALKKKYTKELLKEIVSDTTYQQLPHGKITRTESEKIAPSIDIVSEKETAPISDSVEATDKQNETSEKTKELIEKTAEQDDGIKKKIKNLIESMKHDRKLVAAMYKLLETQYDFKSMFLKWGLENVDKNDPQKILSWMGEITYGDSAPQAPQESNERLQKRGARIDALSLKTKEYIIDLVAINHKFRAASNVYDARRNESAKEFDGSIEGALASGYQSFYSGYGRMATMSHNGSRMYNDGVISMPKPNENILREILNMRNKRATLMGYPLQTL